MATISNVLALVSSLVAVSAAPAPVLVGRQAAADYTPIQVDCPTTDLVRPASTGIGSQEEDYISCRKPKADEALAAWLGSHEFAFHTSCLPTVGLTTSGGSYRSLLTGAGVYKGLDARDTNESTGGLVQGLTYQAGLSGGSWFLSSLAGNNWPTVSELRDSLWEDAFDNSLLVPTNLLSVRGLTEYAVIGSEINAKEDAGYDTTIVDPWGRLLSYQLLAGKDGGAAVRMSNLRELSNFTDHNVPYPIVTTTGVLLEEGQCVPSLNATIYEFHPYEYGSWDEGVAAFADTIYMGSSLDNGQPTDNTCTVQYDNLGYIFGTSSDVFAGLCSAVPGGSDNIASVLSDILPHDPVIEDIYGIYPNPFRNYEPSTLVSGDENLYMADGGLSLQNNPIWPFIQEARDVDVLIVNDNSADTTDNFPNGTEILTTYLRAQQVGLSKMPFIPSVDTFVSEGLNKRATFFGCDEPETVLIIYMPNVNYTFASNQPTLKLEYSVKETNAMIDNGVQIATQNGEEGWPLCLACGVMARGDGLPGECDACFDKYCYRQ